MKKLLLSFLAVSAAFSSPAFSQSFDAASIETRFTLDRLAGEQVTIWKDFKGKKLFYPPAIIPNWSAYESQISNVCAADDLGERIKLKLEINLDDRFYSGEIEQKLKQKGISYTTLSAIPHENIQVFMTYDSGEQLIYELDKKIRYAPNTIPAVENKYKTTTLANIFGTCTEHQSILALALDGEELLSGRLFAQGVKYDTSYLMQT